MDPFRRKPQQLSGAALHRLAAGPERIVLVGAAGWLGMATLELLADTLGPDFEDRVVAFGSSERALTLRGGQVVPQSPLQGLGRLSSRPTVVLHLAFLTKDRAEAMPHDAYVAANRAISGQVLDTLDAIGAGAVFVPSSGAVYAVDDPAASEATRLYGRLKLDDEAAFSAWAERSGGRVAIARVFNVSGPYMNKLASYALSAFILDVLAGRPIEIRATRPVFRSYVAIRELMSVALSLTLDGGGVTRFDTAGEEALEMADIAEAVRLALGRPDHPIRRPQLSGATADVYLGDRALYSELRSGARVDLVGFPTQVRETADYLAGIEAS